MDVEELLLFTKYYFFNQKKQIPEQKKKKFNKIIAKRQNYLHSYILFQYTNIDLPEKEARSILLNTIKNKKKIQQKVKRQWDFRVILLDYLIRNIRKIKNARQIRFIEEKAFLNLSHLIERDELTGLYNFRYYQSEIKKEFSRSRREKKPFSLLIFDIDDFKNYNDTFGHYEGNKVLKKLGTFFLNNSRKTDIVCRYGGEEFTFILPNTEKKAAYILANKLQAKIKKKRFQRKITLSGGIAGFPEDTYKTDRTLFQLADKALYHAKGSGKDCTTLYFDEKRRFPRVGPQEIGLNGQASARGSRIVIENISARGMKLTHDEVIKNFNKDLLKLRLDFENGENIKIDGRIAYLYKNKDNRNTLGLSFIKFNNKIHERIKNILPENKQQKNVTK